MPNTLKSKPPISDAGEDASENPSVLDFLYHDSRRIGSFLSQFEDDGHLQQFTRTKDTSRKKKDTSSHDVKGNIGVASGNLQSGIETAIEANESYAKVFDPYWANARAFLNHLSDREMIQRDLSIAEIGQIVLAKGWLSILDLAMFKDAWKLPTVQRKVREGATSSKKVSHMTAVEKQEHQEAKENTDMMLEMIQIMPHSVHASMVTSGDDTKMLWCTLRDEYLTVPASDIVLAHGATMPGEWTILGILNAQPEYVAPEASIDHSQVPGLMESVVGQVSKTIAPVVRLALGRPAAASALTPLLIFREIS